MVIALTFTGLCVAQPTTSTFMNFLNLYSSVPNRLKKAEDSLTNVEAKIKQVEEEKKLLTELSVKQNKIYDKLYEEKIAKVSAAVLDCL